MENKKLTCDSCTVVLLRDHTRIVMSSDSYSVEALDMDRSTKITISSQWRKLLTSRDAAVKQTVVNIDNWLDFGPNVLTTGMRLLQFDQLHGGSLNYKSQVQLKLEQASDAIVGVLGMMDTMNVQDREAARWKSSLNSPGAEVGTILGEKVVV